MFESIRGEVIISIVESDERYDTQGTIKEIVL